MKTIFENKKMWTHRMGNTGVDFAFAARLCAPGFVA